MRFLALVIFLLFNSSIYSQSISGIIVDQDSRPISGVLIHMDSNRSMETDDEGSFQFKNLGPEEAQLVINHGDFDIKLIDFDPLRITDLGFVTLYKQNLLLDQVTISGIAVGATSPVAHTNINRREIAVQNLGQDIPSLIESTPSIYYSSDAGNGIGYTYMRMRGSDQSRINVTMNGIPYNDSESQQVFWVDLPDFSSSLNSIQVQRGLGTSTNGAGAFGGSVHMNTLTQNPEPYAELSNTFGSYNTRKHSALLGTGLINGHWTVDARLSLIKSDGYVDRASSDLSSYYLSGSYFGDKTVVQTLASSGHEITYQSWYGTPEGLAKDDDIEIDDYCSRNFLSDEDCSALRQQGRTYNFYTYEDQVDNYKQDHYQVHLSHQFSDDLFLKASIFYTKGEGYFEQFRGDDDFADYGLDNPVINGLEIGSGDFVRRRWLDNDFYGSVLNIQKSINNITFDIGGAYTEYKGDHFGRLIWTQFADAVPKDYQYYFGEGNKNDANVYAKANYLVNDKLSLFGDIQFRRVDYSLSGIDNDLESTDVGREYSFINPKLGLSYRLSPQHQFSAFYGIGNREPVRNDFTDALDGNIPDYETLRDLELGYKFIGRINVGLTAYWMDYANQLVLTGALNDVGSNLRVNVPDSYRAGLELEIDVPISEKLSWDGNMNISSNKIKDFTEVIYDYTNGFDVIENQYSNTEIAFSPAVLINSNLTFRPIDNLSINLFSKFVGKQYLDNTSNENRSIDPYFLNNMRLNYDLKIKGLEHVELQLLVNNILNTKYENNGYTYSYIFEDMITENFLYPQAGRNLLAGVTVKF